MKELVEKAWNELKRLRAIPLCEKFIADTMPILYFGDIEAFTQMAF